MLKRLELGRWIALLVAAAALPRLSTAAAPVAILQANGAVEVSGAPARMNTAIYDGDLLTTKTAAATLSLGQGSALLVEPNSSAGVARLARGVQFSLRQGRIVMRVSPPERVNIRAAGLLLTPKGHFPTVADVALNTDGSLVIGVPQGEVAVSGLASAPVTLHGGQFIHVNPTVQQNERAGTAAHGKMSGAQKLRNFQIGRLSHPVSAAIVVGGAAGVITAAI